MSGRNRHRFVAVLFLGTCTLGNSARAQVIQEYDYVPDRIYQVHTGLGITTQIELSPSERVIDYSTGFTSGWDLVRRDNVFYLKPKDVDADTNLMIRTEMHSYIFELRVVATDWKVLDQAKQAGVQYKITFKYPNDTEFKSPAQSVPQLSTTFDGNRHYSYDYDYSTRTRLRWLVPTVVYDDGQFTYIKMTDMTVFPTGDFPAVFAREREGSEDFVVNTTVENNMIVVHGTYPYLVIRHGKNTVGLRRNHSK